MLFISNQIAEGPGISSMARLEQVIKGIKAVQAMASTTGSRPARLPTTLELLRNRCGSRGATYGTMRCCGRLVRCFFPGFFRSGDITVQPTESAFDEGAHLGLKDISVDCVVNPQVLKVKLKASKTDPFRIGIDVCIGMTNNTLCPVAAVLAFMSLRGQGPGPLLGWQAPDAGQTGDRSEPGIVGGRSGYSGHSFRSGAATTAAKQGIGDATIKMLGSAYQLYIKTPRVQLAPASKRLADTSPKDSDSTGVAGS